MSKTKMNSLPGPEDIHREVLPNGIVVLARPNFNSPSVSINGYIQTGSLFDPDDKLGLADFAASALTRGTANHSFDALYNELESVGASLGFDSGLHTTSFSGRALAEDLPLLLGLLSETARQPVFPDDEVEKLRNQLLTGLAIRMQDTSDMADITFDEILYHDHPYSRSEDGNPESIKAITRQDLVDYHHFGFGPRGMVIAVVGAIEPKEAVRLVHRAVGDWKNPDQRELPQLPELKLLDETVKHHYRIADKPQADIVIGTNGPLRKDPEYMAASLGNSILGQFGMMGRVGESVREKAGLAYYVYSSLSAGIGPGAWTVSAGVNPSNVKKAGDLIIKELKRIVKEAVTEEELSDSQANFIGRLPLAFESNSGVAGSLLSIERYDLGLDYYHRYPDLVRSVTASDVLEVARKYIAPDRLAIATAGP
ncbi:MAG: insulinase family protein [Chloroflexi bacterium]|nr:insulinase family protein [Chloroflexota bacterium]MBI3341383.1 insulinase family protein [Chloroflexota bacterium]